MASVRRFSASCPWNSQSRRKSCSASVSKGALDSQVGETSLSKIPILEIRDLHAEAGGKEILRGINLTVFPGEVHAIMGPNGSGKSTLAQVIAGRDLYAVTEGEVLYDGQDLLGLPPEERAQQGLFLAFQYPVEIPGVSNLYFLKAALNAARKRKGEPELDAMDFLSLVRQKMALMDMEDALLNRAVNTGFSGGGQKRNEALQMAVLEV